MKTKELSNKRRRLTLFLLTCLVMNISLHAQVTIGSANNPVAGAILDLNNGAAGGLVLSNVNIEHPEDIPDGFPGITTENATAAKAGLSGALVYNTNTSATCPGVHVWDGKHWERIVSGLPRESAGNTLSITSDVNTLFAGGTVDLEVTTVAKTCTWYEVNSNGADKYLATTINGKFSGTFSDGEHTVKVVSDNCRFLEESNKVFFEAGKVSPSFGSTAGGNYVYIYGEFEYASSSDYVQDGLVAHYDGIDNLNLGDKHHSRDTTVWKDLSGYNYDVKLRKGHGTNNVAADAIPVTDINTCTGAKWEGNGFLFNDYCYFANVPVDPTKEDALWEIMPELPYENENYTIEAVFDPSQLPGGESEHGNFVGWGKKGTRNILSNTSNCISFYNYTGTSSQFRHYWWDNDIDVKFTDAGSGNIKNFAVTYDSSAVAYPNHRTFYYNGSTNSIQYTGTNCPNPEVNKCRDRTDKNTAMCGSFFVGQGLKMNTNDKCEVSGSNPNTGYPNGAKIFSIRVYKGALTPKQIADNYEVDKRRFTSPPTVMFGTEASPEVIVLSPNFLMCKVPASTGAGQKDVVINGVPYSKAYEYVAPSDFHISGISPIIGPATGATVTFTGNKLDEIDRIEVENADCPFSLNGSKTECYVILPAHDEPGEVDIVITTKSSQKYRLAKVFEYQN
jgi:hypothetical protein